MSYRTPQWRPFLPVVAASVPLLAAALLAVLLILLNKGGGLLLPAASTWLRALAAGWVLIAVAGAALVVAAARLAGTERGPLFVRPMTVSAAGLLLALAAVEVTLRLGAVPAPLGERVGGLDLLPYDWQQSRRTLAAWLERTRRPTAVVDVEDPDLGWDLGRGRRSADGLYVTSPEGFRTGQQPAALTVARARYRVALIGDSFTFGEEVAFEDTWGQQLARALPTGTVALNFGVPSHGPDQTLLKYRRDVRRWQADVTVLGFLSASPLRNFTVYPFLDPHLELPFSKPRFVLRDDALMPLNSPPLSVPEMLDMPSLGSLPLLHEDRLFEVGHWSTPLATRLYLARYLVSRFPRYRTREERLSVETVAGLGARILAQLVREVRASGSVPLLAYLPVQADLTGGPVGLRDELIRRLAGEGIPVLDMGKCLQRAMPVQAAFIAPGFRRSSQADPGPPHYSARGNAAIAGCLAPEVGAILRTRTPRGPD
ncbi:MAG: hypothetical protein JNK40_12985 [Chromatiales bacterium]|nr:hypothetical protein [Chromatiales bacterium]